MCPGRASDVLTTRDSVWNLLHAALHRHQFGHDMRRYLLAIRTCCGGRRAAPPATSEQSQQTRVAHRWPAYLSSSAMRRRPSFHLGRRSLSQRHRHNHGLDAQPSFEHTVPSRGAASSHNGSGMGAAAHHANAAAAAATNNYSSNSISLSDRSAGSYAENKSVSQATTVTTTTTRSVEGRGASEERLPQSAPGAKTAVTTAEEVR